jgi:hypothetical protein
MMLYEDCRDLAVMLAYLGRAVAPSDWADECREAAANDQLEDLA